MGERLASANNTLFELNAVFNFHGTAHDADQTLRHFLPNSVAFKEGYTFHAMLDTIPMYEEMAEIRLRDGKYTPSALAIADEIIAIRRASTHGIAVNSAGYSLRLIEGLVEKNCPIFNADYVDYSGEGLAVDDMPWVEDDIIRHMRLLDVPTEQMEANLATAKDTILRLAHHSNALREGSAVEAVRRAIGRIAESSTNIRRTTSGLIQANICYGSGHRDTLTERFEQAGMPFASTKFEVRGQSLKHMSNLASISSSAVD